MKESDLIDGEPVLLVVLDRVERMEHMRGFPRTEKGLQGYAGGIVRLIQDQRHLNLTAVQTLDKLIEHVTDGHLEFPSVAEMHEIYSSDLGFRPAQDGPVSEKEAQLIKHFQEEERVNGINEAV